MTDAQKQKRILRLADFVEKLPRKRFDFRHFVGGDWKGDKELSCGTTACALGWSTAIIYFRRLGLSIRSRGEYKGQVVLKGKLGYQRIADKVFGITEQEFNQLFIPVYPLDETHGYLNGGATPKQWARHARRLVKEFYERQNN